MGTSGGVVRSSGESGQHACCLARPGLPTEGKAKRVALIKQNSRTNLAPRLTHTAWQQPHLPLQHQAWAGRPRTHPLVAERAGAKQLNGVYTLRLARYWGYAAVDVGRSAAICSLDVIPTCEQGNAAGASAPYGVWSALHSTVTWTMKAQSVYTFQFHVYPRVLVEHVCSNT
jgi:hypothetical protein